MHNVGSMGMSPAVGRGSLLGHVQVSYDETAAVSNGSGSDYQWDLLEGNCMT